MEPTSGDLFGLQIDPQTTSYLREAAKWSKFLSIVGFIFCGLMVIFALFAGTIIASSIKTMPGASISGTFITLLYLCFAVLYFFPCLYLFKFSSKMQIALRANDQLNLNDSFANLKSCFKFLGILTVIILSLYVVGIFFVGIVAMLAR